MSNPDAPSKEADAGPSATTIADASAKLASLSKKAGHCKRIITMKTKSVLSANLFIPLIKDRIPIVRDKLN